MSESIVQFKRTDNQSQNLNWKIRSVRERKFSGYINAPSGYQYRIFTCILQKKLANASVIWSHCRALTHHISGPVQYTCVYNTHHILFQCASTIKKIQLSMLV